MPKKERNFLADLKPRWQIILFIRIFFFANEYQLKNLTKILFWLPFLLKIILLCQKCSLCRNFGGISGKGYYLYPQPPPPHAHLCPFWSSVKAELLKGTRLKPPRYSRDYFSFIYIKTWSEFYSSCTIWGCKRMNPLSPLDVKKEFKKKNFQLQSQTLYQLRPYCICFTSDFSTIED